ncbi:uncharacterized protein BJ171DRAFT_282223 [Polychytrium aggregatum]|uniref:uncharacterized protein n=1 Tax=Polychytrium aggregatum TaxID=110093 RepID=UPI0022FEB3C7|nr:uncharacterized protein BJ171DRAFT_282223 [Polychytrium aggregatum]KAI9193249.1 hypothetical protein BJ171DRAFT_282223 [Polychytrium aggregatum]
MTARSSDSFSDSAYATGHAPGYGSDSEPDFSPDPDLEPYSDRDDDSMSIDFDLDSIDFFAEDTANRSPTGVVNGFVCLADSYMVHAHSGHRLVPTRFAARHSGLAKDDFVAQINAGPLKNGQCILQDLGDATTVEDILNARNIVFDPAMGLYLNKRNKSPSRRFVCYEAIPPGARTKLYFDVDCHLRAHRDPVDVLQYCDRAIKAAFPQVLSIKYAMYFGPKKGKDRFLSIHIFCQDTSVVKSDLVRIYAHLNASAHDFAQFTDKADATMVDPSANTHFRVILSAKTLQRNGTSEDDIRPLVPVDPATGRPLEAFEFTDFLCQYLTGNETPLTPPRSHTRIRASSSSSSPATAIASNDNASEIEWMPAEGNALEIPDDIRGILEPFIRSRFLMKNTAHAISFDQARVYLSATAPFCAIPITQPWCLLKGGAHGRDGTANDRGKSQYIRLGKDEISRCCWKAQGACAGSYSPIKYTQDLANVKAFMKSTLNAKAIKAAKRAAAFKHPNNIVSHVQSSTPVYMDIDVEIDSNTMLKMTETLKPIFQGHVGAHFKTIRDIHYQEKTLSFTADFVVCPKQECREPFHSMQVGGVQCVDRKIIVTFDAAADNACHFPVKLELNASQRGSIDEWLKGAIDQDAQLDGIISQVAPKDTIEDELVVMLRDGFGKNPSKILNPRFSHSGAHADIQSGCVMCGGCTRADLDVQTTGQVVGYAKAHILETCINCGAVIPPSKTPLSAAIKRSEINHVTAAMNRIRQQYPDQHIFKDCTIFNQYNNIVQYNNLHIDMLEGKSIEDPQIFLADPLIFSENAEIESAFKCCLTGNVMAIARFAYIYFKDILHIEESNTTMGFLFEFPVWKELPLSNILGRLLRDENLAFSKSLNAAKRFYQAQIDAIPHARVAVAQIGKIHRDVITKDGSGLANYYSSFKTVFSQGYKAFVDSLDTSTDSVVFGDGTLINLLDGTRRMATAEDMFTTTLEARYDHAALHDTAARQEVGAYLDALFDNDHDVASYLLKYLALCLTAERNGEMIMFLVGDAQNGKTMLLNFIKAVLKGLFVSFEGDKLRDNGSGSTGDEVTHVFNKLIRARCAIASEIKGNSTLNDKTLKQLASNDSIEYRPLYLPASDYIPKFKAIVATNTIPEFSAQAKASADINALFRRMIIVNFPMKVVNIPESQPLRKRELRNDSQLVTKIKTTSWIYAMLGLLIDSFPEAANKAKPLSVHDDLPDAIRKSTQFCLCNFDIVEYFVTKCFDVDPAQKQGRVKLSDIYTCYGNWIHDYFEEACEMTGSDSVLRPIRDSVERQRKCGKPLSAQWGGKRCYDQFVTYSPFFRAYLPPNMDQSKATTIIEGLTLKPGWAHLAKCFPSATI